MIKFDIKITTGIAVLFFLWILSVGYYVISKDNDYLEYSGWMTIFYGIYRAISSWFFV